MLSSVLWYPFSFSPFVLLGQAGDKQEGRYDLEVYVFPLLAPLPRPPPPSASLDLTAESTPFTNNNAQLFFFPLSACSIAVDQPESTSCRTTLKTSPERCWSAKGGEG